MVSGELIAVIAMSEPGIGSDLRSMRTLARRDGDDYIVSGQKTFITNGGNAGLMVTATKLDPAAKELTLICIEEERQGFSKGRLLERSASRAGHRRAVLRRGAGSGQQPPGRGGQGFKYLTHQLAWERLIIAIRAAQSIHTPLEETIEYTRERKVFGKPVLDFQNTRFKLAEAKAQATMLRVFVDDCLAKVMRGELSADVAAMAKLLGSEMQGKLLDEFLQLHGGYGFMSEYKISRAWVDARVARIYGGTSEIMKEIIGRTL